MGSSSAPIGKAWSSPEPGVQCRLFDTLETVFVCMADLGAALDREQWALHTAVKLSFPSTISDPTPYLKRAWLATRRLHPCISAVASKPDPAKPFATNRVMTIPALDEAAWVESTFHTHDGVADAAELFSKLTRADTDTIHWIPTSQEYLIRVPHWKIDGLGLVMLNSNFVDILATLIRDGLDAEPVAVGAGLPTRSIEDLTSSPEDEESTPGYIRDAADHMMSLFVQGIPGVGAQMKPGSDAENVVPGSPVCFCAQLNEDSTNDVIKACKERNVSVAAAVHAALFRVLATYPQHPLAKNVSSFVPTDLRPQLPPPHNGPLQATGAPATAYPILVTDVASKSFDQILEDTNQLYRRDYTKLITDDKGQDVPLLAITAPYARRVLSLFTATPPPELPPRTTPSMSNLGIVEKYMNREYACGAGQHVKVESFFFAIEMLSTDMYVHLWTFRNKMVIQVSANSSYYEASFLSGMVEKTKLELMSQLGVA